MVKKSCSLCCSLNTKKDLFPILFKHSESFATTIYSDEYKTYKKLPHHGYEHKVIKHKARQYVVGTYFTNNLENFWSQLKHELVCNRIISPQHLQLYVNEFVF